MERVTMVKLLAALMGLALAAPNPGLAGAVADPRAAPDAPSVSPRAYCASSGGIVQTRYPEYGTNGDNPLVLAYPKDFCEYVSQDGSTHIDVLLSTLVTRKPTLAALAYYSKTKIDLSQCHGSPGSCYCSQVGGTDLFGGISAAGGGWVLSSDSTDVLDVCAFPDLSAIDAYGIFYHAYGIIRGQKLHGRLRYHDPYQ